MDSSSHPSHPLAAYARAFLGTHMAALRTAWRQQDRGASAVELAVITVIILLAAGLIATVIYNFVSRESSQIQAPNP
jgi:Flp pilus assembly protein TadG